MSLKSRLDKLDEGVAGVMTYEEYLSKHVGGGVLEERLKTLQRMRGTVEPEPEPWKKDVDPTPPPEALRRMRVIATKEYHDDTLELILSTLTERHRAARRAYEEEGSKSLEPPPS